MKKIVAILLVVLTLLSTIPFAAAADAQSEVEKDIATMTFDGKAWNPQAFLEGRDMSDIFLIAVDEKDFKYGGGSTAYGYYIYLYNPSRQSVNTSVTGNKVQMAVAWEDGAAKEYEKFDLLLVSKSSDNQYFKFKVVDHYSQIDSMSMQQRMALMQIHESRRVYEITGFELMTRGTAKATDYPYGCKAVFTGFDAGCDQSGKNAANKAITYKYSQTLKLDVQQCYWRTQTGKDVGYRNQINAAYFAVPNDVWDQYEDLYSVKCYWEEYRTTPMIVTDDQTLHDALKPYVGVNVPEYNPSIPYQLYSSATRIPAGMFSQWFYENGYNTPEDNIFHMTTDRIETLGWLFLMDTEIKLDQDCISSDEVKKYYEDFYYNNPEIDSMIREKVLLTDKVDEGRTVGAQYVTIATDSKDEMFPLDNYFDNNGRWKTFWNYNIFNGGVSFDSVDPKEEYNHFKPIEVFRKGDSLTNYLLNPSASIEEIMKKHFFQTEEMAEDFIAYTEQAIAADKTVVLFRYAETDYYSATLIEEPAIEGHSLVSWQTVFLNFDVIELGFYDSESKLRTLPVSNDPEDAIGGVQAPNTSVTDPDLVVDQWKPQLPLWGDRFAELARYIGLALLIVAVLALLPVIINLVSSVANGARGKGSNGGGKRTRSRSRRR